jgi:hypothetical protein
MPVPIPAGIVLVSPDMATNPLFWPGGVELRDYPEPWGSDPRDRWVRLFATESSDGVWRVNGATDVVDDLPISDRLMRRIRRWARWYDAACSGAGTVTPWEMARPDRARRFNAVTRHLGRALKAELPADWTVLAVDIDGWCRPDSPDDDFLLLPPLSYTPPPS